MGDHNIKYFHGVTTIRWRRNMYDMLKDSDGNWVSMLVKLETMVTKFYKDLYSYDSHYHPFVIFHVFPELGDDARKELGSMPTISKIFQTIKYMGSLKALGLDGFQAVLFQKQWNEAVLQALPTYVMQTTLLPRKVLDDIDKVCRNFLWGDIVNGKKIHLVSWDIICSPKFKGGLGLRKIREMFRLQERHWHATPLGASSPRSSKRKKVVATRTMSSPSATTTLRSRLSSPTSVMESSNSSTHTSSPLSPLATPRSDADCKEATNNTLWFGEFQNITYSADAKFVSIVYRVILYGTDVESMSILPNLEAKP
ncbi:hypothetical protein JHK86_031621 [Glycine max]|nr:hypothetical protein JHK86_031621 [Glycine max]